MEIYLVKWAACMAILFAFYKVFLENASFHTLKRGYLLGSLVLSFTIPLITVTTYVDPVTTAVNTEVFNTIITTQKSPVNTVESFNYIPLLGMLYGIGVLFFGIRFFKNLKHILQKIRDNSKIAKGNIYHILLHEYMAPHTFLNAIFFYKKAYESGKIPNQVIWHEEAHAKQKHSVDILFIETLQVILWFNPLLYMYKKAIKLNHEFLADREVLKLHQDATLYQQILVSFSGNTNAPTIANANDYSSIKKRLTVMKTKTSRKASIFKLLLLFPVIALVVLSFSTSQVIANEPVIKSAHLQYAAQIDKTNGTQKPAINYTNTSTSNKRDLSPPIISTSPTHIIQRLAKEHAAFVYEDKNITSHKALELINKNPNLFINVRRFEKSNPIVDITNQKMIFIENANGWDRFKNKSQTTMPLNDPASVIEPYIDQNALFFEMNNPISSQKAKELMREDAPINLKIKKNKDHRTVVILQGC